MTSNVYLKKFVCRNGNFEKVTTDVTVAKKWLKSKENVDILFTDGTIKTFTAKVNKIVSIGKNTIVFSTYHNPLKLIGIDDKIKKIYTPLFYNLKNKEYINLEEAKQAVLNGEEIEAISDTIATSTIKRFISDNKFLTKSYSIYEIC